MTEEHVAGQQFGRPGEPESIIVLDKIRCRSAIQKYAHFSAAGRGQRFRDWLSIPAIAINLILGSMFFVLVSREIPSEAKWVGAFGALIAAVLGGVQTYFNLKKTNDLHRSVANQYLQVSRRCEVLIAKYRDKLSTLEKIVEEIGAIDAAYQQACKEAESVPTSPVDFETARKKFNDEEKFC